MTSDAAADEGSARPIPDPTILTTEQLLREIKSLRELIESEIHATSEVTFEKFRSIHVQLELSERQRVEQKADTKAAVDAALTAQKEQVREQVISSERAIAKSEAATTKQLEQLTTTFQTAIGGVTVALSDVKERVGRIESVKVGGQEKVTAVYAFTAFLVTLLIVIGALATVGIFKK